MGKRFWQFWSVIDISPEDKGKTVELTLFSHLPSSKVYASEVVISSRTGLLVHIFMLIGATIYIILALFNRYKEYTERGKVKEDKEYFERVAYTDALTRGGKRAKFYKDLETITDPESYYIIQANTDRLKYINDYFGHSNGDLAIIDTHNVFNKNFSKVGKVYRIGGDKSSVIVKNADRDEINRIMEQVKKDIDLIAEEREYDFPYLSELLCITHLCIL